MTKQKFMELCEKYGIGIYMEKKFLALTEEQFESFLKVMADTLPKFVEKVKNDDKGRTIKKQRT